MQDTLPSGYEPRQVEERWRTHWEKEKTFTPDPSDPGESYSIVIPPPNVTGALHIGHALNLTLIDVLCRHARQKGKNVLWIPGTDHAGIATQNVVERALAKEGRTRHDLGREEFIKRVWAWREDYGHRILDQISSLGCSVDWTRLRFTMDEGLSKAVRRVFVTLYNEGLIYKGDYIINWCSRCHTALADDEVEHVDTKGKLWHIRYRVEGSDDMLVVATTRPETIPGDTAVCVHPQDERYAHLIGKRAIVPVLGRSIPIIADSYVDREFGTGALKVTPCHDPNDWMLGKRHDLAFIQVIDDNGIMKEESGPYKGLTKEDCRKQIVKDIATTGDLIKTEDLSHSVGHCYRCHTVVEPHVSTQWFVRTTALAPEARAAVPALTRILPESWIKTYYHWLDTIRDWCISRQIWWGHRIPAWTCGECGELIVREEAPASCPKCGSTSLSQDEDVLDTWFSSALWPFSTMGWPEETAELKRYYPTTVLVTGFDIIFFWVARMMIMGQHFMHEVPFKDVYLHALVRDAEGKKMSKSTGNVIDPLRMIEKYGCDALRFTLTAFAAMGRDIRLSEERIEGYRHFVNKLWNAARFCLMNIGDDGVEPCDLGSISGLHNQWILHSLEEVKSAVDLAIEEYRFNDAAQGCYKFLWGSFCDWYLELVKPDMQKDGATKKNSQYVLWIVLREILLLLHPIMPFVTAEIWNALPVPQSGDGSGAASASDIAREAYPPSRPECLKPAEAQKMEFLQNVIVSVRTIKAELNINPGKKVRLFAKPATTEQKDLLCENSRLIETVARVEDVTVDENLVQPKGSASAVIAGCQLVVPLKGTVDLAGELARLDKQLAKLEKELVTANKRLHDENFISKAQPDVVARERARAATLADNKEKLTAMRTRFAEALQEDEQKA